MAIGSVDGKKKENWDKVSFWASEIFNLQFLMSIWKSEIFTQKRIYI